MSLEGWRSKVEFTTWLRRLAKDFTFASTEALSDEDLVMLVADVQGSQCACRGCQGARDFVADKDRFAAIVASSRMERLHAHGIASRDAHVRCQNRPNGLALIKTSSHPHATDDLQTYYVELGKQGFVQFQYFT